MPWGQRWRGQGERGPAQQCQLPGQSRGATPLEPVGTLSAHRPRMKSWGHN